MGRDKLIDAQTKAKKNYRANMKDNGFDLVQVYVPSPQEYKDEIHIRAEQLRKKWRSSLKEKGLLTTTVKVNVPDTAKAKKEIIKKAESLRKSSKKIRKTIKT